MDVTEMVILDEHAAAVAVASEALELPMITFAVTIVATSRVRCTRSIEAIDMDHVKQLVMLIDPTDHHLQYEYDHEDGTNGDEVAYIVDVNDFDGTDEEQVDIKEEGEPYSWDACELIKELAAVEECTLTSFNEFVHKARELCKGGRKKPVRPGTTNGE